MTSKRVGPEVAWRSLLIAGLLITSLLLAGCLGRSYSTSVGEPKTGDVIENVTFEEISALEGASIVMTYSIPKHDRTVSYSLSKYEYRNGSFEYQTSYRLYTEDTRRRTEIGPPAEQGSSSRYQLQIERGENRAVVDAINVTIRRTD